MIVPLVATEKKQPPYSGVKEIPMTMHKEDIVHFVKAWINAN